MAGTRGRTKARSGDWVILGNAALTARDELRATAGGYRPMVPLMVPIRGHASRWKHDKLLWRGRTELLHCVLWAL
jgi:hypothetical protein